MAQSTIMLWWSICMCILLNWEKSYVIGAHTIGFAKCSHFMARLSPIIDPTMDPSFAQQLKQQCPLNESNNPIPFDPVSPFWFDTSYYNALQNRKGLLFSDQVLAIDNRTQGLVRTYASSPNEFFQAFVNSMVKMSSIGVLIGNAGDIRKNCSAINPWLVHILNHM